jgi:secondary thiamine-phosphate synthase enzyme
MSAPQVFDVKTTTRTEMVDITRLVRDAVRASGIDAGIACVYCPHTTAGITLQENTNPKVKHDLVQHLAHLVPLMPRMDGEDEHSEDNMDAHIKSSIIGASITLIVDGGRPMLGHWQAMFLCEFDGPRSRRVMVRVVPG